MIFQRVKRSSASSLFSLVYAVSSWMDLSTRKVQIQRAVAFVKASHPTFPFLFRAGESKLKYCISIHTLPPHAPPRVFSICREPPKKNATSTLPHALPPARSHLMISNRKNPSSLKLHFRMPRVWTPPLFHQSPLPPLSLPTLSNLAALVHPKRFPGTSSTTDRTDRNRD